MSARTVGLDQAKKKLRQLPVRMRNRALRAGFRRIGQRIAKALKALVPGTGGRRTGATRKSIGFRVKLYRSSGNIVVAVGPRSGFSREIPMKNGQMRVHNPTRIFHFIDQGKQGSGGRNYLRQALAATNSLLAGLMQDEVNKAVRKWQAQSTS